MHPRYSDDIQRSLAEEEQAALRAAVDVHGSLSWDRVSASTGLRWPPWRLLQCYHAALRDAPAADEVPAWDAALDDKLIRAAMELTGMSNNDRRRVSWLVRTPPPPRGHHASMLPPGSVSCRTCC